MIRLISTVSAIALFVGQASADSLTGPVGGGTGGSGSGTVTSVATTCGVSGGTITTSGTITAAITQRNNTATTDTLVTGDCGTVVTESNASAVAVAIAQAGTTGFASGYYVTVKNKGAGIVTITPATSTIDGAATLTLAQYQSVDIYSDGANYWTLAYGAKTIALGSTALGTGAITSATCASAVTATATGVLTTDTVTASFNGDPTAVTGYVPATAGMLTIFAYPTAGNVNFKVCNNTSSSITPGAITLNWRVAR